MWQRRCTADLEVLARSWPDGANIGVGCRASGVVGLDLDRHEAGADGVAVFAALCAVYGQPWPSTFTVVTPHSGRHLYFRVPPEITVVSSIGRWPGIDVRAPGYRVGGYRAGPGAVVDGAVYAVQADEPIAPLPQWLAVLLIGRATEQVARPRASTSPMAGQVLRGSGQSPLWPLPGGDARGVGTAPELRLDGPARDLTMQAEPQN